MAGKMMEFSGPDGKTYLFEAPSDAPATSTADPGKGAMEGMVGGAKGVLGLGTSPARLASNATQPEPWEGYGAAAGATVGPFVPGPGGPGIKSAVGAGLGSSAGQGVANILRASRGDRMEPFSAGQAVGRGVEAGTATYLGGKVLRGVSAIPFLGKGASNKFGNIVASGGIIDAEQELNSLRDIYLKGGGDDIANMLKEKLVTYESKFGPQKLKDIITGWETSLHPTEAQHLLNAIDSSRPTKPALTAVAQSLRRKVYGSLSPMDQLGYQGYGTAARFKEGVSSVPGAVAGAAKGLGKAGAAGVAFGKAAGMFDKKYSP